jgi:hypothetical protein
VPITLSIGNAGTNPGGGSLFGATTVSTNAVGVATFPNLVIDREGTGYELTASADNISASSNAFSLTKPATISFETFPNGTAVTDCVGGCQVRNEFSNFGVVFAGASFLQDTAVYDAPNSPANHAIDKTSGSMTMSFAGLPTSVQYLSTQNNSCNVPVQAVDAAGNPLPVAITNSFTYVSAPPDGSAGSTFRRETVVITNSGGIAGVTLNDPICGVFVDNLAFNATPLIAIN